jgi:hypothetical protein
MQGVYNSQKGTEPYSFLKITAQFFSQNKVPQIFLIKIPNMERHWSVGTKLQLVRRTNSGVLQHCKMTRVINNVCFKITNREDFKCQIFQK